MCSLTQTLSTVEDNVFGSAGIWTESVAQIKVLDLTKAPDEKDQ